MASSQSFGAPPPREAWQSGYIINTFSVSRFTAETVDTDNSKAAGFKFYPYNLFGTSPPLSDLQLDADGSLTLLGAKTGPNGEIVSATPYNFNTAFHGTAFGGGALFQATLQFSAGTYNAGSSGGWPAWWAQPVETAIIYASGTDQWPGQAKGYHHSIETDFMEYLSGNMGSALHESWGLYNVTCPPNYCQSSSALPHWTVPRLTQSHRYGWRWTPATATSPGKAESFLDGVRQSSQSWQQFVSQAPPPTGQPWAFGGIDQFHYVLILGTGTGAPVKVLNVNVWQRDGSHNLVQ